MINDMDKTKKEAGSGATGDDEGLEPIVIHPEIQGDGRPFGEPELERRVQRRRRTDVDLSVIPAGRLAIDGESYSPPELSAGETKRAFSLDALRGLFLLSMTFGFTIMSEHLPAWMYHRQFDPHDHVIAVFGISWRDLAYASFLFTMAAAIPLTLTRRMDNGEPEIGIIFAALRRTFLLIVFALMVAHSNTFFLGYTDTGRLLGLLGFGLMWLVFTRRRKDWRESRYKLLNRIGWVATIAFLLLSPLAYGKTFTFSRNDDIIIGLAFAALTGSILWYFTRKHIEWRLVVLAGVVALYVSAHHDGWVQDFWFNSDGFLFDPSMLTLLTVVVPGTIAGDLLLRWMRSGESRSLGLQSWTRGRTSLLSAICLFITPLVVVGLYNRWVEATTLAVLALVAAGFFLVRNPRGTAEELLQKLFLWGALWLVLGLFLEPSEGGIRKVPETLSYFFTVTGTTSLLLVAMTAIVDVLDKRRFVRLLIDLGHNPLLCYVIFTVFLNSIFELIHPLQPVLQGSPGESILRSIIMTILSVLIVRYFTRRRIFWRT
jgi:predicted acyltransferase